MAGFLAHNNGRHPVYARFARFYPGRDSRRGLGPTLQEEQLRSYVQQAARSQSSADQLAQLADLRDRDVITAEESDREKAKILA
jgi:hypothetical protein